MTDGFAIPEPFEAVAQMAPFTVRRTVRWSECDPAGVVYAGNFPTYMSNTVHQFRTHVLKIPTGQSKNEGYDTPTKAISMVFLGPLRPLERFDMAIHLGATGKHTVHFHILASRSDDGAPVFAGRLSSIYVSATDRTQTLPVPDTVRAALRDYASRSGPVPSELDQIALR